MRLANRGRLLLRTPGPVPFGTYICSNVETILSWTSHVYGPFEFRTSLGTSILLIHARTCWSQAVSHVRCIPQLLNYFLQISFTHIRGLFKKLCYERLSIRKNNVCLTDFVLKSFSFNHTCTCEISKELSKYQYSYWHSKWHQSYTLAYIWRWKGGKLEDVDLHKMSCCDEKFAPNQGLGTNFWE